MAYRISTRWWRPALVLVWGVAVAALTLVPNPGQIEQVAAIPSLCLLCGARATADAILNIVLFLPLGLALGGLRGGLWKAMAAGLVCSAGIELFQTLLPGRHSTVSDLVWNGGGAALGVWLFHRIRESVLSRPPARLAPREVGLGVAVGLGFVLAGALMTPQPTEDDYWSQWTPDLGHMPQYGGQVLEASLNGDPMPMGQLRHQGTDEAVMAPPWRVDGTFIVGPEPVEVSPIVSIYDGRQLEVLLLGAHGDDLVFRERNLAHVLRFDSPDVRLVGALTVLNPGDTAAIGAERSEGDTCLRVGAVRECGVGVTPSRGWGLLLYPEGLPGAVRELADLAWLLVVFFPIGFFTHTGLGRAGGAASGVVGMLVAVPTTPLVAGPWFEVVACLVGVQVGRTTLLLLRRVAGQAEPAASIAANE